MRFALAALFALLCRAQARNSGLSTGRSKDICPLGRANFGFCFWIPFNWLMVDETTQG